MSSKQFLEREKKRKLYAALFISFNDMHVLCVWCGISRMFSRLKDWKTTLNKPKRMNHNNKKPKRKIQPKQKHIHNWLPVSITPYTLNAKFCCQKQNKKKNVKRFSFGWFIFYFLCFSLVAIIAQSVIFFFNCFSTFFHLSLSIVFFLFVAWFRKRLFHICLSPILKSFAD